VQAAREAVPDDLLSATNMCIDVVFSGTDSEKWLRSQMKLLEVLLAQSSKLQAWQKLGRESELRFSRDTNEQRWRALLQSVGRLQKAWTETQKIASKFGDSAAEEKPPDSILKFDFMSLFEAEKLQKELEEDALYWSRGLTKELTKYQMAASDQCSDYHLPETSWKKHIPADSDYKKVLAIAGKHLQNLDGDGVDETLSNMLEVHDAVTQVEDMLGMAKTWDIFAFLPELKKDVAKSVRMLETIKIESVLWFSLTQKTKTTALSIMQKPLEDLKAGALSCKESDIQAALLSEAKRLLPAEKAARA
ncbi:unnamed protein product, partial [Symbiodinium microadriaticum]